MFTFRRQECSSPELHHARTDTLSERQSAPPCFPYNTRRPKITRCQKRRRVSKSPALFLQGVVFVLCAPSVTTTSLNVSSTTSPAPSVSGFLVDWDDTVPPSMTPSVSASGRPESVESKVNSTQEIATATDTHGNQSATDREDSAVYLSNVIILDTDTPTTPANHDNSTTESSAPTLTELLDDLIPTNVSSAASTESAPSQSPSQLEPDPTFSVPFNGSIVPSMLLSPAPTGSFEPTSNPTSTFAPSNSPSIPPTLFPSISSQPSMRPTTAPSMAPSHLPSEMPSVSPSYANSIEDAVQYIQKFLFEGSYFFNETQILSFQFLMENYTTFLDPSSSKFVNTTCVILDQKLSVPPLLISNSPSNRFLRSRYGEGRDPCTTTNSSRYRYRRRTQTQGTGVTVNTVSYRLSYVSDVVNVTGYPSLFKAFMNLNLDRVTFDLNMLGLPVTETQPVSRLFSQTPMPTTSSVPSMPPSMIPTVSPGPSIPPSMIPSSQPTERETASPMPSSLPSTSPTPLSRPSTPESQNPTIIVAVVVVMALCAMVGLFFFYRRRKKLMQMHLHQSATNKRVQAVSHGPPEGSWNAAVGKTVASSTVGHSTDPRTAFSPDGKGPMMEGFLSPSESLVSNQSLLSTGNSMAGDSGDEADTTQKLMDEFDKFRDQNLEKMRAEVEGNLSGFDGMMSQALTKALMDDDEPEVEPNDILWGGVGQSGAEIEASALCDVTDWLKRNDSAATTERKQSFMRDILYKMVSSVRHGILGPDDASRTIHECAALLSLQLASDLPADTIIIQGMRKNVTAKKIIASFREFGEIDDVAVASNQRGFGLVRFKSPKSVDRALKKCKVSEIVVQDVGVTVRTIKPQPKGNAPTFPRPLSRTSS
ncbi:expressed unknown protein [Seminavis robusta]|uniref:RRM domain-containing protein n=1 Tax=Seminavis robusta TaxID=568900 RepID=A0A9N8DUI3_9STRA|nr:expressed unknown protein [Seminavis robusta]|eukprot:Sro381_g130920.1 n/a (875) ;mRNA; r:65536-68339